ncbi:TPA: hypothetical protein I7682_18105 [Vibrio vulnificus]|nr:hypothetical protein [Vibrio vulnificus]
MGGTLLYEEHGCKVYENGTTILRPLLQKAVKFTNVGLVGYQVIQAPATVYCQIIKPNQTIINERCVVCENDIIPFLVVRGWAVELSGSEDPEEIGFMTWADNRHSYLITNSME